MAGKFAKQEISLLGREAKSLSLVFGWEWYALPILQYPKIPGRCMAFHPC